MANQSIKYDPRFRNDQGLYYTQVLFYEMTNSDKSTVLYTLKDQEHMGYPSIKQLYLEMEDITEYEFANEYFGGWSHWLKLQKSQWFREHLSQWREELELKIKARALHAVRRKAQSTDKDAFSANKYLLEKGYETKKTSSNPVGRVSKERIKEEALRLKEEEDSVREDAARILN